MRNKLLKALCGLVCVLGVQDALAMNEIEVLEKNIKQIQKEVNRIEQSIPSPYYPWQQDQVEQKVCLGRLLQRELKNQQNKLDNLYAKS